MWPARHHASAAENFVVFLGLGVVGFIIVTVLALLFLLYPAKPALAHTTSDLVDAETQIRRDCTSDALRFCKAAIITADRSAIIACMVANRDRLRPRCAAHIY